MWVDGNDPQWRARRNSYLNKTESETSANNSEARWIENDELKYSLRSVELFAPWINRIYIVTDNQSPKWLNRDNPKIHIIDHNGLGSHWHPWKNGGQVPTEAYPINSRMRNLIDKIKNFKK